VKLLSVAPSLRRSVVCRNRNGISLVELAIATVLTGILMVAALQSAGQAMVAQRVTADRSLGHLLAQSLLNEIRALPYEEPGMNEPVLGPDAGENAAIRTTLDDIDDYHGLTESPPKARDGASLGNTTGWTRTVSVAWVRADDFSSSASASGAKRITVTASYNGTPVATATAVRTDELWAP
jgi:type II secretory pathway pseudopilin PulG